jgi:RND family efflux transporter MFP subunit
MMQIFSGLPIRRLAAALLTVSLLAGCADEGGAGPSAATAAKPALTVRLVAPERAEWPELLVANGDVVAWQEAVIGAEVANYRIAEVRVQVGDAVRRGDVLARIASDTVASELAEAAAAVAEAEAAAGEAAGNAERARELRAQGFYSAQLNAQLQSAARMAAARLNAARARLRSAQLKMDKTAVRAPDDGIISARRATVGSLTQPGEELFRLIRGGRLEWRAEVPSADLLRVPVGTPARLTGPNGGTVSGTVRAVAPSVDAQTRKGLIYVDLPPTEAVRAGMFAGGEFELGRSPALSLPQTAVVLRDGFAYVFRLEGAERVAQTKVELGRRSGERVEIVAGLPPDAQVVASGAGFLADGDVVKVVGEDRQP